LEKTLLISKSLKRYFNLKNKTRPKFIIKK
jgi:hypothetical protein